MTWRCFHCGEEFVDRNEAYKHFGETSDSSSICQLPAEEIRQMEADLCSYRLEDTELHRKIWSISAEKIEEVKKAEDAGYAKGVSDMRPYFMICQQLARGNLPEANRLMSELTESQKAEFDKEYT